MRLLQLALLAVSTVVVAADEEETPQPTTFDGVTVPPLMELTPSNWAEEVNKTQFLMVKHYRSAAGPFRHVCRTQLTIHVARIAITALLSLLSTRPFTNITTQ
jgi:protein disulfide-isomerase